eukprot:176159-Rhodomonas_salina.1
MESGWNWESTTITVADLLAGHKSGTGNDFSRPSFAGPPAGDQACRYRVRTPPHRRDHIRMTPNAGEEEGRARERVREQTWLKPTVCGTSKSSTSPSDSCWLFTLTCALRTCPQPLHHGAASNVRGAALTPLTQSPLVLVSRTRQPVAVRCSCACFRLTYPARA